MKPARRAKPRRPVEPVDPRRARTYPLGKRRSKIATGSLARALRPAASMRAFLDALPHVLAADDLRAAGRAIADSHQRQRPILVGMGAHVIKVGLSPILIDLMQRGVVSALAMNGAGIVHDFELAFQGATSEDVDAGLADGRFGMARETGAFLNECIRTGARDHGIGRAVGEGILRARLPHRHLSLLATAARLDLPATVHVGIGTDIIHMHPTADGGATGEGSLRDFRLLAAVVGGMDGGVFLNLGSAVIIPEVFVKALNLARNLGRRVRRLTCIDMDFIRHYRPHVNVVSRPTAQGGRGISLTGHHEIMVPLLAAAVLDEIDRGAGRRRRAPRASARGPDRRRKRTS